VQTASSGAFAYGTFADDTITSQSSAGLIVDEVGSQGTAQITIVRNTFVFGSPGFGVAQGHSAVIESGGGNTSEYNMDNAMPGVNLSF